MQRTYRTLGIILKKRGWRDADLLFSIYTEKFGKIDAAAIGVRKNKSKLAGHLSFPGFVELNYVRGKAFNRLTHAFLKERCKLESTADFYFYSAILEIMDKTTREGETSEKIWKLIKWACEKIFNSEKFSKKMFVLNIFIIKLLALSGYEIRSEKCVRCSEEIIAGARYDFTFNGFHCEKCARAGQFVSFNGLEIINATKKPQTFEFKLAAKEIFELNNFLTDYLEYYTERKFNSLESLKTAL